MAMVSVHIKVKDFGEWRKSFDKDKAARDKVGIIREIIFQNADNPNDVAVVAETNDPHKMIEALRTPEWKKKMQERGVEGDPLISILQST
jgi:hypothetical protein